MTPSKKNKKLIISTVVAFLFSPLFLLQESIAKEGKVKSKKNRQGQEASKSAKNRTQINLRKIPQSFRSKYIGRMTIKLNQDKQMKRLFLIEENLSLELQKAQNTFDQKSNEVNELKKEIAEVKNQITAINTEMADSIVEKENLKKKLAATTEAFTKRKVVQTKKKNEIKEIKDEIQAIDAANTQRVADLNALKEKKKTLSPALKIAKEEFVPIKENFENHKKDHGRAVVQLKKYKRNLLDKILHINHLGSSLGREEGHQDGLFLSNLYGVNKGTHDGDQMGTIEGTKYGIQLAQQMGAEQGTKEGRSSGKKKGKAQGMKEGTIQGNKDAGNKEGTQSGIDHAIASDASEKGKKEGTAAGLSRAKHQGELNGTLQGESKAIESFESGTLKKQTVSGNFTGAFSSQIPSYPGFDCVQHNGRRYKGDDFGWRGQREYQVDRQLCPQFNPRHTQLHGKKLRILKKAFRDGYIFKYRRKRALTYRNTINTVYTNSYNSAYSAAYTTYQNPSLYPDEMESSRVYAFNRAENITFQQKYEEFYKLTRLEVAANPKRDSSEYTSEFNHSKKVAYKHKYNEIKSASFKKTENATFNANIGTQVQFFSDKQYAKISKIYQKNAVLKYINSSIHDGGVKSGSSTIAAQDGVYQPGEKIIHQVKIANFGLVPASNLKIVMKNGRSFPLPNIAPKSIVTIKGAAISNIGHNAKLNRQFKSMLRVYTKKTITNHIKGRHFANPSQGLINSGDVKKVQVRYPLMLSNLSTKKQLLKDKLNGLSIVVTNNSNRNYSGNLKIEISSNSKSDIITKGFNSISSLSGAVKLTDAEILVSDMIDVYKALTFSAVIKKNGVVLGVVDQYFQTMAKTKYQEKRNLPTLIANSSFQSEQLLDAIEALGGIDKMNILDLSLPRLNAETLQNGFTQKVLIALNDPYSKNMNALNEIVKKSSQSSFIIADDNGKDGRGIDSFKSLSIMNKGVSYQTKFIGFSEVKLYFNNMYIGNTKGINSFLQSTMHDFSNFIPLASGFTMDVDHNLQKIKNEVTEENFSYANLSLQIYNLKALAELTLIKKAYKKSGEDSKYIALAKSHDRMYRKLFNEGNVKLNADNSGVAMSGIAFNTMLKKDFGSCFLANKVRCTVHKKRKKMVKSLSKNLKKYSKDVRNDAEENATIHDPRIKG